MMNWLRDKLIAWLAGKLDGKKTYIAGAGFILLGIAGVIGKLFPDQGFPDTDWENIGGFLSAGFAAFGLGHKGEKILAASSGAKE